MSSTFDRIYEIARRVPYGRVATYGQIARMLGNPRLSRIVGCAMHAAPGDVPCHRIVNRLGELCDAFSPLGRESHRILLEMEDIPFTPNGRIDLAQCQWKDNMTWQALMDAIAGDFEAILGNKLTGLYIHGSIAFGCFRWETSDIDFLAVASAPLTQDEKVGILECLLRRAPDAPPKGIEMSIVLEKDCRNPRHPIPFELHFSNAHLARVRADLPGFARDMHGQDPDLAGHFAVTQAAGLTWRGKSIGEIFAPVPREALLASILSDVQDARDGLDENPVYHILNLCRTLACVWEGKILSKAGGGEWGIQNLPEEHRPVILSAQKNYAHGDPMTAAGAREFRDYALKELSKKL